MTDKEHIALTVWRLQQLEEGETIDPIAYRWLADAIELLKRLGN